MIVTQSVTSKMAEISGGCLSKKQTNSEDHHHNPDQPAMTIRGRPPLSNTRTSLPQIKSKFDLEPNPFEQSFKENPSVSSHQQQQSEIVTSPSLNHLLNGFSKPRRTRSSSPNGHDCRLSPAVIRGTPGGSPSKVSLPGIASITSPAILLNLTPGGNPKGSTTNYTQQQPNASSSSSASSSTSLSNFSWGFNTLATDSLRTGPLSPALLNGPVTARQNHSGLTPLITMGHSSGGAFTPTTQAIIAMLSSNDSKNPSDSTIPTTETTAVSQLLDPSEPSADEVTITGPTSASDSTLGLGIGLENSSVPETLSAVSKSNEQARMSPRANHQPSSGSENFNGGSANPASAKNLSASYPLLNAGAHPTTRSLKDGQGSSSPVLMKSVDSTSGSGQAPIPNIPNSAASGVFHSVSPVTQNSSVIANPARFQRPTSAASVAPVAEVSPMNAINLSKSLSGSDHAAKAPGGIPVAATNAPLASVISANANVNVDDHYTRNPLYLLTAAHEASSRVSSLNSHSHPHNLSKADAVDDATVTAAAALTGLGSSGGSRYSSPGPSANTNGPSVAANPAPSGSNTSSPTIASHSIGLVPGPSVLGSVVIPPVVAGAAVGMVPPAPNQLHPPAGDMRRISEVVMHPIQSSSSTGMPQPGYPAGLGESSGGMSSTSSGRIMITESSSNPLPYGTMTGRKKGKKRKEPWEEAEPGSAFSQDDNRPQSRPGTKAMAADDGARWSGGEQAAKGAKLSSKGKKGKKSKADEDSELDSDGGDAYWPMEDEMGGTSKDGTRRSLEPDSNATNTKNRSGGSGKPETEEEKRKNFLERNRQAALKCRQRKKAWLANLQTKVGLLTTENESLQMTINQLREEIDSFRSILISHKDCPISVGNSRAACTTIGELAGHESGLAANAAAILVQQQQNARAPLGHHQHPGNALHHHPQRVHSSQRPPPGANHRYAHGVAPSFGSGY